MKFRLATILWVFALFASAMATFGTFWGILISSLVVGFWILVFKVPRTTRIEWLVIIAVLAAIIALMVPVSVGSLHFDRGSYCLNNLRNLALALHSYKERHNTFPAAISARSDDQAPHSWRVAILPYVEQELLFLQYDHNQEWNSAKNSAVTKQSIDLFHCISHTNNPQGTSYFAVVGDQTAWPEDRGRSLREFIDGTANTLLLIEAPWKNVPWAKPEDITFEEAVKLLSDPPSEKPLGHTIDEGFFYKPSRGINVAFVDAKVQLLRLPISKEQAIALLTVDGGEKIDGAPEGHVRNPELDYGRIYALCAFVLLSLLPTLKLRSSVHSSETEKLSTS